MPGTTYRGFGIYDGIPSGAAGVALNDNFELTADNLWQPAHMHTVVISGGFETDFYGEELYTIPAATWSNEDEGLIVLTNTTGRTGSIGIEGNWPVYSNFLSYYVIRMHLRRREDANTEGVKTFIQVYEQSDSSQVRATIITSKAMTEAWLLDGDFELAGSPPQTTRVYVECYKRKAQ